METATPEAPTAGRTRSLVWWTPLGVVAAHCVFGLLRFDKPTGPTIDSSAEAWSCLSVGVSLGQPVLCAAWAALASGRAWRRIACAAFALAALGATNVIDNAGVTAAAYTVLFLSYLLVLAYLRAKYGWRLTHANEKAVSREARRLGIRTLLAWTTAAAVLAALWRRLAEMGNRPILPGFFAVITGFAFALAPMMLAADFVLAQRLQRARLFVVYAILTAGLVFTGGLLVSIARRPPSGFFLPAVLLSLGALLDAFLTAGVLRWAGYRLVSGSALGEPLSSAARG